MKKLVLSLVAAVAAILAVTPPTQAAQNPASADDFLSPLEGGPREVAQPAKVKVAGDVVEAATAQDAVNAAVKETKTSLAAGGNETGSPGIHARLVKFPSGMGVVAGGLAGYENAGDPVMTRISQRNAYMVAFLQAKQNLAAFLRGLSHESEEALTQNLASVSSAANHLNNLGNDNRLTVKQAAESLLRGFVVYEVDDDTKSKTVYVCVATTPKTRGRLARPSQVNLEAASLRDGLNQVLAEVKSGVTFPVGGRVITVPSSGETAVVGFGSYIVRTDSREAVAVRLQLDAQKTSSVLAMDSLCGILIGDRGTWEGTVNEHVAHLFEGFQESAKGDPLAPTVPADVKRLDQRRESIVAESRLINTYRSIRRGDIPPGVIQKTWFNEDNTWAFGVAVYLPSVSRAASQIAEEMDRTSLLVPIETQPAGSVPVPETLSEKPLGNPGPTDSKTPIQRGPSGRLNFNDL